VDVLAGERRAFAVKPLKIKRPRAIQGAGTDRGFHGKTSGDETEMTSKSQHQQLPNMAIIAIATPQAKLLSLRCRGGF